MSQPELDPEASMKSLIESATSVKVKKFFQYDVTSKGTTEGTFQASDGRKLGFEITDDRTHVFELTD